MTHPSPRPVQYDATDPAASAWVSANAGSGKTFVLTRRVVRLLLSGCEPSRILCLTFTKAAAAEMANRVFRMLGDWAVKPDEALAAAVADVEGAPPARERLADARRLFARALETPGGLKIKTIHGFCEALLQRFPVEADLPGRFEVLDDRGALALRAEARAKAIREAAADADGALGRAFALLLARCPDHEIEGAVEGYMGCRDEFRAFLAPYGSLDEALADLPRLVGVPDGATRESLVAAYGASPELTAAVLGELLPVLDRASSKMVELAAALRAATGVDDPHRRMAAWRAVMLTKDGDARKSPVTKAVDEALPGTSEAFRREAARCVELDRALAAVDCAEATAAAMRLADRVIGHYAAAKREAGALDFDDLIQRTRALLSRSDAAAWVQYKLDQGLDHVLVDEAQDTSESQWAIVRAITGDFFAGAGARGPATRTVFAVGDEKQSIYSFQGAEPRLFAESGRAFERSARDAGVGFGHIRLNVSYRSTADVVKAVDAVFSTEAAHAGLTLDPGPTVHESARRDEPGLVEVWPEIEAAKAPKPERWEDPVDATGAGSPEVRLAQRIAAEIRGWLDRGERIAATGRRIRPGDVLVLVRKRGAFVEAVNRELKLRGVPIAGADRLDVIGHVVAEDLMAAARVALLPEDDLTLAAFARSPLVPPAEGGGGSGLSDDELHRLAAGRDGSLWGAARRAAAGGDPAAGRLVARVETLMARADGGEPFGFFAAIVGRDGGRAAFRARIGREADEVIDEFLALAMAAEDGRPASLAGFLALLAGTREDVRREVDAGRDEVRVMTVHGSKGLEAPVVFLVDPGSAPASGHHDPRVMRIGGEGGPPVWLRPGLRPAVVDAAVALHRDGQEKEYRRLLYVGLTRAADRLVVAGVRGPRSRPEGRWHTLVREALGPAAEEVRDAAGEVERWRWRLAGAGAPRPPVDEAVPEEVPADLPAFLTSPAPLRPGPRALSPSAAAALAGTAEEDAGDGPRAPERAALDRVRGVEGPAARRGRLVHRLFELLPETPAGEREARALAHLARQAGDLPGDERAAMVRSVLSVIGEADWAEVFGPGGRAEVAVAGTLDLGGTAVAVSGQIDRLVATGAGVLIVDYKTGRTVPDRVPDRYVLQLALYRALIRRVRPAMPVRAAILWTELPRLDEVGADDMEAALARLVTNMGSDPAVPPA